MLKFKQMLFKRNKKEKKDTQQGDEQKVVVPSGYCEFDTPEKNPAPKINYDQYQKIEISVGEILSAEKVENADRLLKLDVCFGDHKRQIISGIAEYFENPRSLIGKRVSFVTNLEPRTIRGFKSDGMILAAGGKDGAPFSLLEVNKDVEPGTKIS